MTTKKGSLGVRLRGKGWFHLEVRTGSHGVARNRRLCMAQFGRDREWVKMAHDVAKLCFFGKAKFLALREGGLNFWESRTAVAELFQRDARMVSLAGAHRQKDEAGQSWDEEMKKTLRELASDALRQLGDTAEAQAVDSQNINVGYGDEGSRFDIVAGLEDGAAPINWPHTKEALRSISPELPELSPEVQLEMALNGRLKEEKKTWEEEKKTWEEETKTWEEEKKTWEEEKKTWEEEKKTWEEEKKTWEEEKKTWEEEKKTWEEERKTWEEEKKTLKAMLTSRRFPEGHGLQSSGDY